MATAGFRSIWISLVVDALFRARCYQATKYLSPTQIIRATKPRRRGKRSGWDRRDSRDSIVLSVGRPNYLEVRFIAKCRKAGEPFPIRKIQLRNFPSADN